MRHAQHPYRENKLEVWIRDHAVFVEDSFDSFLSPGTIL